MDEVRISPIRPAAPSRPGVRSPLRAGLGWLVLCLAGNPAVTTAVDLTAVVDFPATGPGGVHVTLDRAGNACHVRGEFHVAVSPATAWQVLTDYDGITRFVHSVRESRLERGPGGERRLRQDAVGSAFFVRHRVHVLLELDEVAERRLGFRDVLDRDFRVYAGEWRCAPDSGGVRIEYELRAEPSSALLRMFCRSSLLRGAQDLLAEVRAEMVRRAPVRGS